MEAILGYVLGAIAGNLMLVAMVIVIASLFSARSTMEDLSGTIFGVIVIGTAIAALVYGSGIAVLHFLLGYFIIGIVTSVIQIRVFDVARIARKFTQVVNNYNFENGPRNYFFGYVMIDSKTLQTEIRASKLANRIVAIMVMWPGYVINMVFDNIITEIAEYFRTHLQTLISSKVKLAMTPVVSAEESMRR